MTGSMHVSAPAAAMALTLTSGLPLLLALAVFFARSREVVARLLPWAVLPALFAAFWVPTGLEVEVPWFFMGVAWGFDATGRDFLWSSALVWGLAALALRRMPADKRSGLLVGSFLMAMAGNFGLILARDLLGFYLFFGLMSFSAYGLVVAGRRPAGLAAGRLYIGMVMMGEVALFAGLVLLVHGAGDPALSDLVGRPAGIWVLVLLYVGMGVKIGALPLHLWMKGAYCETPPAAGAALAGAMVNAGVLGWLRLLFPLAAVPKAGGLAFVVAGAVAVFYGVWLGLRQQRPGGVLAGSSISQLGLMTVVVGCGLVKPELRPMATVLLTLFAVHHSLAKSSLFLAIIGFPRKGRRSGWSLIVLLIPALALAGLPLTCGSGVKTAFKELLGVMGPDWQGGGAVLLSLSSVATTLLVLHFVHCLRHQEEKEAGGGGLPLAWWLSVALVGMIPWLWPQARAAALHALSWAKLWPSAWPMIVGAVMAWFWLRIRRPAVQESVVSPATAAVTEPLHALHHMQEADLRLLHHGRRRWRQAQLARRLRKADKVLGRWVLVGLCYLALCVVLLSLL